MTQRIVIDRPRDPLAGMIDQHRGRFARKWRVAVDDVEGPAERAPAASSGETDAIYANTEAFDRFIRRILFWKEVQ